MAFPFTLTRNPEQARYASANRQNMNRWLQGRELKISTHHKLL